MPLVLATGAPTASGHEYDDVFGEQYEFPTQYRSIVTTGETFAYYVGRRGHKDGRAAYLGVGIVGMVRPSSRPGQLVAEVKDVHYFDRPIPAKNANGDYLETGSSRGTNWANGVRRTSDAAIARIVASAGPPPSSIVLPIGPRTTRAFSSPAHVSELERYSVAVAMGDLAQEYGVANVLEMPPGNPGFDILVARPSDDLHVEVKGTILPEPTFHLSEGQRQHAASRGSTFRLIVVYDVHVRTGTHKVVVVEGPLDDTKVDLQAESWPGRVQL